MSDERKERYGDDVFGMSCCCGNGRCGDGHKGCYYEAVMQQKRKEQKP